MYFMRALYGKQVDCCCSFVLSCLCSYMSCEITPILRIQGSRHIRQPLALNPSLCGEFKRARTVDEFKSIEVHIVHAKFAVDVHSTSTRHQSVCYRNLNQSCAHRHERLAKRTHHTHILRHGAKTARRTHADAVVRGVVPAMYLGRTRGDSAVDPTVRW
jgi:hypothetical protein